jgi:hypothetical protein
MQHYTIKDKSRSVEIFHSEQSIKIKQAAFIFGNSLF